MNTLWQIVSRADKKTTELVPETNEIQCASAQTRDPERVEATTQTVGKHIRHAETQTSVAENDRHPKRILGGLAKLYNRIENLEQLYSDRAQFTRIAFKVLLTRIVRKVDMSSRYTESLIQSLSNRLDTIVLRLSHPLMNKESKPTVYEPRAFKPENMVPISYHEPIDSFTLGDLIYAMGPIGEWRPAVIQDIVFNRRKEIVESITVQFLDNTDLTVHLKGNCIATHIKNVKT